MDRNAAPATGAFRRIRFYNFPMKWAKQLKKRTIREGRLSPVGRTVLGAAAVAAQPLDYMQRRLAAADYNRRFPSGTMTEATGYAMLPAGSLPGTDAVLATCRRIFEVKKAAMDAAPVTPKEARQKRKGTFLKNLLDDRDRHANSDLVEFALSDSLFSVVTNYLGVVPTLNGVDLVYSIARPDPDEHISSQLFHQDPEGLRQAKVFMNVFDVDEPQGPFMFIPAHESGQVIQRIRDARRKAGDRDDVRYQDEEVAAHGGLDAMLRLKGPSGSACVVDTSRCLHAGSRIQPGHFRLVLYLQYCTSREKGHSFDASRFRNDPVRWLALKRHAA